MEQVSGCHGDHSLAQRLEASSLTTPSPTGELALMLRMLVPLLYLGKTPALLRLLISTQTLITTLQCQLVQYREWATSVLPWLYPHSHQRINVGVAVQPSVINFNVFHSNGGSDCWGCCRTDRCRGSTDNHSLRCLHVSCIFFWSKPIITKINIFRIRRRQHSGFASKNPAYGMSAPNDAVNVQSNDEPEYEVIRGK